MAKRHENEERATQSQSAWGYLKGLCDALQLYRWIWREFVMPMSRRYLCRYVAAIVVHGLCAMLDPWFLKSAADALIARDGPRLVKALAAFVATMAVGHLCRVLAHRAREVSLGEDWRRLDIRSTELAFEKSIDQHVRSSHLLSPATLDKGRMRTMEMLKILEDDGIPTFVEIVASFIGLWLLSAVGGLTMTGLLAVYLAFLVYVNRQVLVQCTPIDAEFRRIHRYRMERLDSVERVKANGKEAEEIRFLDDWFVDALAKDRRFWLWCTNVNGLRGFVAVLATGALVAYAFLHVWNGTWTYGFLWPFIQWIRRVTDNLWRIADLEHRLNWNVSSVRAFREALTMPPTVRDAPDAVELPPDVTPRIELCGVSHAYQDAESRQPHVLRDVSLTIEPGEKVAVMGPSGAGKTTIMSLLLRAMDPERGSVRIGGHDLRQLRLAAWCRMVGLIAQRPRVFDASIRDNLAYGLPTEERVHFSDEAAWTLMRQLRIDFEGRLMDGLETNVGPDGLQLSGGQAQRLMIGAAVAKKPRVMLIDEATSALDSTTEREVQAGLAAALAPETSALVVAHRLSTVRHLCTKFVVLRAIGAGDGPQVEAVASSFEELYGISPTFRRLADDQGISIQAVPIAC